MALAAVIQISGDKGVNGNLQAAAQWIDLACAAGAKLVVLPENFAYYGSRDLSSAALAEQSEHGPAREFLARKAKEHGIWLIGGTVPIVDLPGSRPYAASLLLSPQGNEVARYNKIHLFDVDIEETGKRYRESDDYQHGDKVVVVETPVGNIGLSVCYDLRFPELYRQMMSQGAEILVAPSAFTAATGKAHWQLLLRARAVENLSYMLAANLGNRTHKSTPTWGGSAIIDPWGEVMSGLDGEEGYALSEIDLKKLRKKRRNMPALEHRRIFTV